MPCTISAAIIRATTREPGTSRNPRGSNKTFHETLYTSLQYDTEKIKGGPQLGHHYVERREPLGWSMTENDSPSRGALIEVSPASQHPLQDSRHRE